MKKPNYIIFDWDNTIVDSWLTIHHSLVTAFEAFGKTPWSLEETKQYTSLSLGNYFPNIFNDDWMKAREIYYQAYQENSVKYMKPLPNAVDLLEALATKATLMVISNKRGDILRSEAKSLQIEHLFHKLVGSMDTSEDKPSKIPVEFAMQDFAVEINSDNVWFIGDSHVDVACAINCGAKPIFFGLQHDLKNEDLIPLVAHFVENHSSLAKLLNVQLSNFNEAL